MPRLVRSYEFVVGRRKKSTHYPLRPRSEASPLPTTHWRQRRPGFSLIEILLSMFLLMAIVSILLVVMSTFLHSRRTSLQTKATTIATRDIENQREAAFASVQTDNTLDDPELSQLPSGGASRTVTNFEGNANIKQVTVTVSWTEKGLAQQIKLDTLISANGI